jgi:hypothetical protein
MARRKTRPAHRPLKYTVKQVERALKQSNGRMTDAARRLGCPAQRVYEYLKRFPALVEIRDECREALIDKAEDKLEQAVDAGNMGAVYFTLSTLGKNRGFTQRTEVAGPDGGPLKIVFEFQNDWRTSGKPVAYAEGEVVDAIDAEPEDLPESPRGTLLGP